jgi:hypothetical protein
VVEFNIGSRKIPTEFISGKVEMKKKGINLKTKNSLLRKWKKVTTKRNRKNIG